MDKLNSDVLRTFIAVAEMGSVTEGATQIFRSQSATSLQIQKLESLLGRPVFKRHGRGVSLTDVGERLLPVARDITSALDVTMRELTSDKLQGKLHIGIPDDESKEVLSRIVGEFVQSHPLVELEVTCALSASFANELATGSMDLAVYELENPCEGLEVLREEQTTWVMSSHHDLLSHDPLPIALFDHDCWWRDTALATLRAMGRPYRIVYSSQSVAGVVAAIEAGIAIGLLGLSSLNDNLRPLGAKEGFNDTSVSRLVLGLRQDVDSPEIRAMQCAIRQAYSVKN